MTNRRFQFFHSWGKAPFCHILEQAFVPRFEGRRNLRGFLLRQVPTRLRIGFRSCMIHSRCLRCLHLDFGRAQRDFTIYGSKLANNASVVAA